MNVKHKVNISLKIKKKIKNKFEMYLKIIT